MSAPRRTSLLLRIQAQGLSHRQNIARVAAMGNSEIYLQKHNGGPFRVTRWTLKNAVVVSALVYLHLSLGLEGCHALWASDSLLLRVCGLVISQYSANLARKACSCRIGNSPAPSISIRTQYSHPLWLLRLRRALGCNRTCVRAKGLEGRSRRCTTDSDIRVWKPKAHRECHLTDFL